MSLPVWDRAKRWDNISSQAGCMLLKHSIKNIDSNANRNRVALVWPAKIDERA